MQRSKIGKMVALFMVLTMAMSAVVLAVGPLDSVERRYEDGVVYVPLRAVAYAHGATVEWNSSTRTVIVTDTNGNAQVVALEAAGGFIDGGVAFITLEHAAALFYTQTNEAEVSIHGAIHRVQYGDNVVYLFGTLHGWRDSWSPLAYEAASALARADVLALEVYAVDAEAMAAAALEYAMYLPDGQSWAEFLPQEAYEHLIEVLAEWGIEYDEEIRYMNPQLLLHSLAMQATISLMEGDLELGGRSVDSYIMDIALERGIPIIGLESIRQQTDILFNPPIEVIVDGIMAFLPPAELIEALKASDELSLDELAYYYETNNLTALYLALAMPFDLENESVSEKHMREMLLNWRSTYYANRIAELLQETEEPTTFFVAVGLSHIIRSGAGYGFTDIIEQLRLLGFEVVPLF